jgi:Beta-propeller repeat
MRLLPVLAVGLTLLSPTFAKVTTHYGKIPLNFEPNRGQAGAGTLYLARGNGYLLSLEPSGSKMILRNKDKSAEISNTLLGSSKSSHLEALDPLPGHSSYFRGHDPAKWVTGVPNFARVRAAGVYPGIDLIYYGNQDRLEYDFVVAAGADPSVIRLRLDGIRSLRTDAGGDLVLSTAAGDIIQQKPDIYQTIDGKRQAVAGRFVIHGRRTVTFELASYDHSRSLVIDPVLVYSSFLGNGYQDEGNALAADAAGNLYLVGDTYSLTYGDSDVMIRKISPDGSTFLYTANMGGSDNDFGTGIAVDPTGSVYVGGYSASVDFPLANAFQNGNAGNNNAIVLRLDPTGSTLIFSTYIGGSFDDRANGLALDNQGNVYLTGGAASLDFPVSTGAYQTQNRGSLNCFVVEFDSQGNGIASTYIGGGSQDQANAIAVDSQGNSYITGQTDSDSYPQVNPSFQHSRHGGNDAFVTELSGDFTHLVYSTFAGGGSDDFGYGIAVNSAGQAYVMGTTNSSDFPTTNGAYQRGYAGSGDMFILAYSANGQNLMFSTFLGSHGVEDGNGIALDSANNIYVVGDTNSDQYPVTSDAVQRTRKGGFDIVFSVLDPTGSRLMYSSFLGGSGDDSGSAVAVDPYGNVYLTGITISFDYPLTPGAAQTQPGGGTQDAFFAKVGFSNPYNVSSSSQAAPAVAGNAVSRFQRAPGNFTRAEIQTGRKKLKVSPYEDRFRRQGAGFHPPGGRFATGLSPVSGSSE